MTGEVYLDLSEMIERSVDQGHSRQEEKPTSLHHFQRRQEAAEGHSTRILSTLKEIGETIDRQEKTSLRTMHRPDLVVAALVVLSHLPTLPSETCLIKHPLLDVLQTRIMADHIRKSQVMDA